MAMGACEEAIELVTLVCGEEARSDLFFFGTDFTLLVTSHDWAARYVLPRLRACTEQTTFQNCHHLLLTSGV